MVRKDQGNPKHKGMEDQGLGGGFPLLDDLLFVAAGPERGHYERDLFRRGISQFSRISRKWSDSPLLSSVWAGGSLEFSGIKGTQN